VQGSGQQRWENGVFVASQVVASEVGAGQGGAPQGGANQVRAPVVGPRTGLLGPGKLAGLEEQPEQLVQLSHHREDPEHLRGQRRVSPPVLAGVRVPDNLLSGTEAVEARAAGKPSLMDWSWSEQVWSSARWRQATPGGLSTPNWTDRRNPGATQHSAVQLEQSPRRSARSATEPQSSRSGDEAGVLQRLP
jgi:hypothetical protein